MKAYLTTVWAIAISICIQAQGAGADEVCLNLSRSGLIDTSNKTVVIDTFSREFRDLCSFESNRKARFEGSSSGFQAAFKGFGLSASGSSSSDNSEEFIKSVCDKSEDSFSQYLQTSESISTGSLLADRIVECAEVLAMNSQESILGTVRVDDDDKGVDIVFRYVPGDVVLKYALSSIPNGLKCYTNGPSTASGSNPKIVLLPNASVAIYCVKEKGVGVKGSFNFAAVINGETRGQVVSYDIRSRQVSLETEVEISRRVQASLDQMKREIEGNNQRVDEKLDVVTARKFKCESQAVDVRPGKDYFCPDSSWVVASCVFGKNHSTYTIINENGRQGCRNQNEGGDWGYAICCKVE